VIGEDLFQENDESKKVRFSKTLLSSFEKQRRQEGFDLQSVLIDIGAALMFGE
jgi:hypothetical protein